MPRESADSYTSYIITLLACTEPARSGLPCLAGISSLGRSNLPCWQRATCTPNHSAPLTLSLSKVSIQYPEISTESDCSHPEVQQTTVCLNAPCLGQKCFLSIGRLGSGRIPIAGSEMCFSSKIGEFLSDSCPQSSSIAFIPHLEGRMSDDLLAARLSALISRVWSDRLVHKTPMS